MTKYREECRAGKKGGQPRPCLQVFLPLPICPPEKGLGGRLAPILDAVISRLGEPSTHTICITNRRLRPNYALPVFIGLKVRRYRFSESYKVALKDAQHVVLGPNAEVVHVFSHLF